ncbi:MAG TPA: sugar fermentation stimulation protein [Lachnoclostridium phytofermentans]|uniref:Sugar fermentation stimulation protein n=2 Tax=Lachnoclostridium TaxID=1506553 RepID=A0A3D2XAR9_9FIRM|nr:sugar fermentation stimulation protein [Lachnoclostridium phytofermentans]
MRSRMKKKDRYLDFDARRKKLKFTARRKSFQKREMLALLILVIALGLGTCVFFYTKAKIDRKGKSELSENQLIKHQHEELSGRTASGPYGMWIARPTGEKLLEPEEDKEVWMANFKDGRNAVKAKGIYITASKANKNIDDLLKLVDDTELNAMVIDIKDDDGRITYQMNYQPAIDINATRGYISDINGLIRKLKEQDVYLIARVVAFKDPVLADKRPELALKLKDGSTFRDKDKLAWVNPYKKEVWDYLVGIASQCAALGFDEVNFDYIRFSTDSGMANVDFGVEASTKTKIETITEFVKYACEKLRPLGIFVSADVYGAIISSSVDAKIVGQSYLEMSKYLDYICPMIYPSHYGEGYYGIKYPDTEPYNLILAALDASRKVLNQIPEGEHRAKVRPWLQDFTAPWIKHYIRYGSKEVRDQIEAVYDSDYSEWLLWNGNMNYTKEALYTEEEATIHYANRPTPTPLPLPTSAPLPTRAPNSGKYYDSPWKSGN